jgi:hypothetical protein
VRSGVLLVSSLLPLLTAHACWRFKNILFLLGDSESDLSELEASEPENFCKSWEKLFPLRIRFGEWLSSVFLDEPSWEVLSEDSVSLDMAAET